MSTARTIESRPPSVITVNECIEVRRFCIDDAASLVNVVTESLEHLRPWMAWISLEPQTIEQRRLLIEEWNAGWNAGTDFGMGIFENDMCIGSTGFHLRGPEHTIEIGYWLAASHVGRGIMSAVVDKMFLEACLLPEIASVEIVTDKANAASGAVAQRCGFTVIEEFHQEPEAPGESGHRLRWAKSCFC